MKKHRVQIDMTVADLQALDRAGKELGAMTRAETVRRCVRAVLRLHAGKKKEILVL